MTQEPESIQDVKLLASPQTAVEAVKEREIGYVIDDKYYKGFEVLKTYSGWWKDKVKVEDFIRCVKQGYNLKQSRIFIGISEQQWRDFRELHPAVQQVIEHCEEVGKMMAETNIHSFLQAGDKETTRWFAERRIPDKYGRNIAMGEGGPVINNFGTIISAPRQVPQSVIERMKEHGA